MLGQRDLFIREFLIKLPKSLRVQLLLPVADGDKLAHEAVRDFALRFMPIAASVLELPGKIIVKVQGHSFHYFSRQVTNSISQCNGDPPIASLTKWIKQDRLSFGNNVHQFSMESVYSISYDRQTSAALLSSVPRPMESDDRIKVALVEDSRDEREALCILLRGSPGFCCAGAFQNGEEALSALPKLLPHIVLMDIHLPGLSGIECIRRLKPLLPATRIMMLTVFEDHDRIFQSLRAGANAYLLKKTPPAQLLESIRELHQGGAPMSAAIARQVVDAFHEKSAAENELAELSTREQEIVNLLARGFLYKEIAEQLGISLGTVRTYIGRVYEKLHVRSRAEAMLKVLPKAPR